MAKKTKSQVRYYDENQAEVIKGLGGSIAKSLTEDLAKEGISDLWKQMLGTESGQKKEKTAKKGELQPGEELHLQKREQVQRIEPGIDYAREFIQAEKIIIKKEQNEVKVQIQEILMELRKITKSSKELEIEFKDVTVETMPVNPGKFHLNFFEWVLSQLRRARMRIEDSAHWTSVIKSKKSQRQYWHLFKKHGTSFGLSGERIVATQVG